MGQADVEQFSLFAQSNNPSISLKDGAQLEVRIVLNIRILVYNTNKEDILTDLKVAPIDTAVLERLPGFVIYYVKQGDSLWQIKEINNLTSEEIKAGDRLLIVK